MNLGCWAREALEGPPLREVDLTPRGRPRLFLLSGPLKLGKAKGQARWPQAVSRQDRHGGEGQAVEPARPRPLALHSLLVLEEMNFERRRKRALDAVYTAWSEESPSNLLLPGQVVREAAGRRGCFLRAGCAMRVCLKLQEVRAACPQACYAEVSLHAILFAGCHWECCAHSSLEPRAAQLCPFCKVALFLKRTRLPWPGGPAGWSVVPNTKRLWA